MLTYGHSEVTPGPPLLTVIGQSKTHGLAEGQEVQFLWLTREGGFLGLKASHILKPDSGKPEWLAFPGEMGVGEQ